MGRRLCACTAGRGDGGRDVSDWWWAKQKKIADPKSRRYARLNRVKRGVKRGFLSVGRCWAEDWNAVVYNDGIGAIAGAQRAR